MRADVYIFSSGYAKSRAAAQALISDEAVIINGEVIKKPSENVDENADNKVEIISEQKYVSRGGYKLEYALESFSVDPSEFVALDIGASTGGFTDCLLKHGASKVYSIDAGVGQLDRSLLLDERVINFEKYNARSLNKKDFPDNIDIAVMDVSFISQTLIIPSLSSVLDDGACFISLIKPQFEVGRSKVGKNGIVKSIKDRHEALENVISFADNFGLTCKGIKESVITGGDGNVEYVALFVKGDCYGIDHKSIIKNLQR